MKRIKLNFAQFKPINLVEKTKFVVMSMEGNINFTTPSPALADVLTEANALLTAIGLAEQGTKAQKHDRDEKAADLVVTLTQLAGYVTNVAANKESVMLSSGFDLERARTPVGLLGVVENLRTKMTGVTGEVEVKAKKLRGAAAYKLQMTLTPDEENSWVLVATIVKARTMMTGLPSLTVHYFRMAGIGASGQGPWSEVADGFAK
ncbi:MAG: hypothetical protein ACKVOR_04510 [Flavobacteriales bacterium]